MDALTQNVHSLKRAMLNVIDMEPSEALRSHGKANPPVASFQLAQMALEAHEREIRRRGMDPADERFGVDLMGEIRDVRTS